MKYEAFLIALVGFFIVFMILVLISSAIKAMGWILRRFGKADSDPKAKPSSDPAAAPAGQTTSIASESSEELLLALIASALMEENAWSGEEFQIISVQEKA